MGRGKILRDMREEKKMIEYLGILSSSIKYSVEVDWTGGQNRRS